MDSKRTLGIIPARGGSKGINKKNIRIVNGDPLINYTIRASNKSNAINRTIVTTDSTEIANTASSAGAEVPFLRPSSLAKDDTPTEPVITHALSELDESFSELVLLQPTSPLRTATHINEAADKFRSTGATSLVSAYEDHSYRWHNTADGATRVNYNERMRRQEKTSEYVENGAIYMTDVEMFLDTESLTAGQTEIYEMSKLASVDIDEPDDLRLATAIMDEFY